MSARDLYDHSIACPIIWGKQATEAAGASYHECYQDLDTCHRSIPEFRYGLAFQIKLKRHAPAITTRLSA